MDITRAETISIPLVFIFSFLIFGSLAAAVMPTLVGAVAVLGRVRLVRAIAGVTDVSVFAINVITLLGMGLAIDYALFVVSRFREEMAAGDGTAAARSGRTMATAGRTVFFSGIIVTASLSSLLLFPLSYLSSLGYGGMAAVLVAMLASLTVLPAVLALLGPRIEWGRWAGMGHRRRHRTGHHRWASTRPQRDEAPGPLRRLDQRRAARPGSPSLQRGVRRGRRAGAAARRAQPGRLDRAAGAVRRRAVQRRPARHGWQRRRPRRVRRPAGAAGHRGRRGRRTAGRRGRRGAVAGLWPGHSQSQEAQQVVEDLRAEPAPDGVDVQVGGATATTVDIIAAVGSRLPWMALTVVVVMMVLLFVAFGSVVLPLKAILMNTVSLGASFGALTWIFQDGHLSGPLNFEPTGYLDATQPILMLAVLFGLSMDYEIFLLSRIREEWDLTHDNTASVAAGVQHTGRIITSAALLLSVVIAGFATSDIVMIKFVGVGMLVAVLLDATVVRALLVPATMRLLGRANWWAPGPLRRWWERHGHGQAAR